MTSPGSRTSLANLRRSHEIAQNPPWSAKSVRQDRAGATQSARPISQHHPKLLARNRVLVLADVVAIARELVDRIAQVAHIDRLRDSTSAGKKARLEKKRNRTRCCLHFSCRNCRARQGKSSPVRRVRVGAKILRLCQRQSLKQA